MGVVEGGTDVGARTIPVAVLGLLLVTLATSSALAQGSAGGSVGDTEKTLSGNRGAAPQRAAAHAKAEPRRETAAPKETAGGGSRCQSLVGSWSFSNGVGVLFKPGGGLSSTTGDGGSWTCENGMVAAHWARWTDHYLVASDGVHITGNSGFLNGALTAIKN